MPQKYQTYRRKLGCPGVCELGAGVGVATEFDEAERVVPAPSAVANPAIASSTDIVLCCSSESMNIRREGGRGRGKLRGVTLYSLFRDHMAYVQ